MSGTRVTYVRNDTFTGTGISVVGGSREHYFHFLIGYLLPLVFAQINERFSEFFVLDCGPLMNPILINTLSSMRWNYHIVKPSQIEVPYYLDDWDYRWNSFENVQTAANAIISAWVNHRCQQIDCPCSTNIIIQRSNPHPFYLDGRAEISGYGTNRRSISNWTEVQNLLIKNSIDHEIYEPGRHSLGCQILTFRNARKVVGIRGAEWANAIWSLPGINLRIFDPNPPATLLEEFLNRLGLKFDIINTSGNSFIENPNDVLKFFQE